MSGKRRMVEPRLPIAESLQPSRAGTQPTTLRSYRLSLPWLAVLSTPLTLLVLLPLLAIVLRTPPAFTDLLRQPEVWQALVISLRTSAITTALAILLGTPVAYLLARHSFRGRTLLDTLFDAPLVLPPAVAGVGLLLAFGRRGIWGASLDQIGLSLAFTQAAVVMAQLFVAAPFYVKAAAAGLSSIHTDLEEAAALDGANEWQTFRMISVPLAGPAIFAGAVMTWARALGEFGATLIFAGNLPGRTQTMPLAIYLGFEIRLERALTLAIVLLICSFGVLLLTRVLLRQRIDPR